MQALSRGTHISSVLTSVANDALIASTTLLSPSDFNGTVHYHDNAHLSFVLKGGCSEKKRHRYERVPGSITWYDAGEIHQIVKVKEPSFHVNFELPASFYKMFEIDQETIATAIAGHPSAKIMMLGVLRELHMPDENTISSLELTLLNLIQESAKVNRPEIPKWVKTLKELLNDRWQEKITLNDLSWACDVHPVTISKYFPHYFGCTLSEYLRTKKVDRAIGLIKQGTSDLSAIAFACGFADQSHFIRAFKSATGFLPAAYRKL